MGAAAIDGVRIGTRDSGAPDRSKVPSRRGAQEHLREAAAWLADRLRDELAEQGSGFSECSVREMLGANGETLLRGSDAASLVKELRSVVFVSYDACSVRYKELSDELAVIRSSLEVERKLVAFVDSLDARLPRSDLPD
jgi:hypothetical protein